MDLVLKLREIRKLRGLSQKDVARLSGVGEKTISSFETGQRIDSLKIAQLKRLLGVYGLTEAEFFGSSVERQIAPWELDEEECAAQRVFEDLRLLPKAVQKAMVAKMQLMLETATEVNHATHPTASSRHDGPMRGSRTSYEREWSMLNSRN
jgi:HTH-type transcriptional regulator, competence development regulator